ncbi:MAG: phage holin family protein [Cytophagaceae bacterium]|nr:phage holin family protein [Cytophagaceae bacterium]
MSWIINLLINAFAVWLVAAILPGVKIRNFISAIWVSVLLALVNGTLGWILKLLTLPFNIITFGLVGFIINVLMILLVDKLTFSFHVRNFWWAALFAILVSIVMNIVRLFV